MREATIIMPMAGLGSRFKKNGYIKPKPLIEINNTIFYKKALSSLSNQLMIKKVLFIIRNDNDGEKIRESLINYYPIENIISIENLTSGALETCMAAKHFISNDSSILIIDCDLWFQSTKFEDFILNDLKTNGLENGGAVSFFHSNDEKYSYGEIKNGLVMRTAEKKVISNCALIGAYYFSRADKFFQYGLELIYEQKLLCGETYIAPLFNKFILNGFPVYAFCAESYQSFGTADELLRL